MKRIVSYILIICLFISSVGCTWKPITEPEEAIETPSVVEETIPTPAPTQTSKPAHIIVATPILVSPETEMPQEKEEEPSETISVTGENREQIATMMAKTLYRESRGITNTVELACIVWTILNRVDAGYGNIYEVITAPYQFAYDEIAPMVGDYGQDFLAIALDVISRWEREHAGETDVGRVLPSGYLWYLGDGAHNWFRNDYYNTYRVWDYSFPSPYEN